MDIVRGYLQAYDWGQVDGLARWTAPTGGPQAELWFGTHPNGPSVARDGGQVDVQTPILTKILAAARPLSIQIHPSADFAQAQFASQRSDPRGHQLLPDPYAKAEILIAVEPFTILEGFRDTGVSAEVFAHLGPQVAQAADALRAGDLPGCIRGLLTLPMDVVVDTAPALPAAMAAAGLPPLASEVIEQVVACYPDDPGVFVAALLNARTLAPGESIYVEPGTVHAYVQGLGVEVMTASDNVLRLGLTSKTVAIDAALAALSVSGQPRPVEPEQTDGVATYAPQGSPFSVVSVADAGFTATTGAARTVLCMQGEITAGDIVLAPGDAILLEASEADLQVEADGRAVIARAAS